MAANEHLQPSLFHGTTREIKGQILPAKVHGGLSYWDTTGSTRNEPSNQFAWAHPSEGKVWEAAQDRVNYHYAQGDTTAPRARVYAVHPNAEQSPGHDTSMEGEIKSTHFDISHEITMKPGHQGTFPEVNWNSHVATGRYLPGDEDANHPSHLSVQFGHSAGVFSDQLGDDDRVVATVQEAAKKEDTDRYLDRVNAIGSHGYRDNRDTPLPGMQEPRTFSPAAARRKPTPVKRVRP